MKHLALIFKVAAGLLTVTPGISYFSKSVYPVNIPSALLIVVCEIIALVIILSAVRNKDRIRRLSEKRKAKRTVISVAIALLLFVGLGVFCQQKVVSSRDKGRYLLPLSECCSEYIDLKQIAFSEGENIAEHLGVDKLTKVINNNCSFGEFMSRALFFTLVTILYNVIVFIFIFLGFSIKTAARQ